MDKMVIRNYKKVQKNWAWNGVDGLQKGVNVCCDPTFVDYQNVYKCLEQQRICSGYWKRVWINGK